MKLPGKVTAKKGSQKYSEVKENDTNKSNAVSIYSVKDTTSSVLLPSPKLQMPAEMAQDMSSEEIMTLVSSLGGTDQQSGITSEARTLDGDEWKNVVDCSEEEKLLDNRKQSSRASSVYDDSGFNSCASEDRDDIEEALLNIDYDCDLEDNVNSVDEGVQETPENLELKIDKCVTGSEDAPLKTSLSKSEHVNSETDACISKSSNTDTNTDSSMILSKCKNVGMSSVGSSSISVRNSQRNRRRELNNLLLPSLNSIRPRSTRGRRHKDCNNNDTGIKSLHSFLGKSPFRLVDCFQEKGILSFVACIAYTLLLVFLFGVLSIFVECAKSVMGKENLKDMKKNIIQARRSRMGVTSG